MTAHTLKATENVASGLPSADRVTCPCDGFTVISKLVAILEENQSDDASDGLEDLLQWLRGETDQKALDRKAILTCGKRSRCRFRYGVSFAILNAIRDGCRDHLDQVRTSTCSTVAVADTGGSNLFQTPTKPSRPNNSPFEYPSMSYDEAFPSLQLGQPKKQVDLTVHPAASNFLVPRSKKNNHIPLKSNLKTGNGERPATTSASLTTTITTSALPLQGKVKKKKRRIRPQLTSIVNSNQSKGGVSWPEGNIASLPSEDPFPILAGRMPAPEIVPSPMKNKAPENAKIDVPLTPTKSDKSIKSIDKNCEIDPQKSCTQSEETISTRVLDRLVEVYATMIEQMLVPSTPLEIHFLLRMLTMKNAQKNPTTGSSNVESTFGGWFSTAPCCRYFATKALLRMSHLLINLSILVLDQLVRSEVVRQRCPKLTEKLEAALKKRRESENWSGVGPSENDIVGTHAILSLPFNKERDSRHNYKTPMEMAVYKNREETRDAFLHQLRTFMSVKGKAIQPSIVAESQVRVQKAARKIMNNLMNINVSWFAEFFCQLLLQVGLSPVEETDEELMNMTTKDKLQQLNRRLLSRTSDSKKSSGAVSLSQNKDSSSPLSQAKLLFPGYQEFFFLVVTSAQDYNFGIHLRSQLAALLCQRTAISSTDIEKKLLEKQLLSRFLGYLVFSPNWHPIEIAARRVQSSFITDGLQQLESLGLPLEHTVNVAWQTGSIIAMVPWVLDILRLAQWDSLSQSSANFRRLLSSLRHVQSLLHSSVESFSRYGPSLQISCFGLERFFRESIGLEKLTSLPQSSLASTVSLQPDAVDKVASTVSNVLVFSINPHLEDLSSLIASLNRPSPVRSPTKSRKLRPSAVDTTLSLTPSKLFDETESTTPKKVNALDYRIQLADEEGNSQLSIQEKLSHAFFHQHPDLRELCEFAVGQVLKSAHGRLFTHFASMSITGGSTEAEIATVFTRLSASANDLLDRFLRESLRSLLDSFADDTNSKKVRDIATDLAVQRGQRYGRALVERLLSSEIAAAKNKLPMPDEKSDFLDNDKSDKVTTRKAVNLTAVVGCLQDLLKRFEQCQSNNAESGNFESSLSVALNSVHDCPEFVGNMIPDEGEMRALYGCLLRLDGISAAVIDWGVNPGHPSRRHGLFNYLRLVSALSPLSVGSFNLLRAQLATHLMGIAPQLDECIGAREAQRLFASMYQSGLVTSIALDHLQELSIATAGDTIQEQE